MANKQVKFIESFPLYAMRILSSLDVMTMSIEERGAYFMLLFVSWIQRPKQCYLKLDDAKICKVCNISPDVWDRIKDRVLDKFVRTDDDYIYNEVLLEIWHEAVKNNKPESGKQLSSVAQLINYPFDEFWNDYDKKVGSKDRLIPKWLKLTAEERELIRMDIPKRKAAQPDKKYRPNPETYINGKLWNNEIINYKEKQKTSNSTPDYNAQGDAAI